MFDKRSVRTLIKPSCTSFYDSAMVSFVAFIIQRSTVNLKGTYCDLTYVSRAASQFVKVKEAIGDIRSRVRFNAGREDLTKIPGQPIAFWVSESIWKCFLGDTPLGNLAAAYCGMTAGDNDSFRRRWFEVSILRAGLEIGSFEAATVSVKKWFPYNNGGGSCRWYGNDEWFANFENGGIEVSGPGYAYRRSKPSSRHSNRNLSTTPTCESASTSMTA